MKPDGRDLQFAALRHRLSMLSEASLRITESLDLDTVLQGVLESARSLTDDRYALICRSQGSLDQSSPQIIVLHGRV